MDIARLVPSWSNSLLLGVLLAAPALAGVVLLPTGLIVAPNPGTYADPIAADVWLRENVRNGASIGITNHFPRNDSGSGYLNLGPAGSAGKADWEYYPSSGFGRLADLQTYSYDWYRSATSTVGAHLHPAMRLLIDADGDLATSNDRGHLVFERCYNISGCPAVPTDVWTTDSIGDSTLLWWSQFGVGINEVYDRTLAQYKAGSYVATPGFAQITGNSLILGISLGIGSGWNGSFEGAIDNATLARSNAPLFSDNLEINAPAVPYSYVPVPALPVAGMLGLGALLLLVGVGRSRRQCRRIPRS